MESIWSFTVAHWYIFPILWGAANELFANNPNLASNSVAHAIFVFLGWAKANPPKLPS